MGGSAAISDKKKEKKKPPTKNGRIFFWRNMLVEYETRTEEHYQRENKRRNAQRLYRAVLLSEMIGDLDPGESTVVVFKSKGMDNQKNRIILEKKLVVARSDLIALGRSAFSSYDSLARPLVFDQSAGTREKKEDAEGKELADKIIKNTKRIVTSIRENLYGRSYKEGEKEEILESEANQRLRALQNLIEWRLSINSPKIKIIEGNSQYSIDLDDEIRIAGMDVFSVLMSSGNNQLKEEAKKTMDEQRRRNEV